MRSASFAYNDEIKSEILNFLGKSIKHDYMQGSRDINLDLTVQECQALYESSDQIREMAESGELQALHQRCVDQAKAVDTGYIKVMDLLDKTGQQINEAEADIYEDLVSAELEGLQRLDSGYQGDRSILDTLSGVFGDASLENYEIVKRAAEAKGDSDVINAERSLKSLLMARARLFSAKAAIQEAIIQRMSDDQVHAVQQELDEFRETARRFGIASESEETASSDDVYSTQLQQIFDGDMAQLMRDIDACAHSQAERAALYQSSGEISVDGASFREDLLRHLAGSLVIKEHRIRYQKEQFDRFVASIGYKQLKDTGMTLDQFS